MILICGISTYFILTVRDASRRDAALQLKFALEDSISRATRMPEFQCGTPPFISDMQMLLTAMSPESEVHRELLRQLLASESGTVWFHGTRIWRSGEPANGPDDVLVVIECHPTGRDSDYVIGITSAGADAVVPRSEMMKLLRQEKRKRRTN